MPIHSGQDKDGQFYQWGKTGKKYYYDPNDKSSKQRALNKAKKQQTAIYSTGWKGDAMKLIKVVKKKDYDIGLCQYSTSLSSWKVDFITKFNDLKARIKNKKVTLEDVNDSLITIGHMKRQFESLEKLFAENEAFIDKEWKKMR